VQILELYPCEMSWTPVMEMFTNISHILIALNSSMNILIYAFKVLHSILPAHL
jgi:hypothetical protein